MKTLHIPRHGARFARALQAQAVLSGLDDRRSRLAERLLSYLATGASR